MRIMLRVREAKETPAEYLTIELLLSGGAGLPAMAVATAVAMTAASCLLSGVMGRREGSSALSSSSSWIFGDPGSSDFFGGMLQRKDAGKAGRRGCSQSPRSTSCCLLCHHLHTMS